MEQEVVPGQEGQQQEVKQEEKQYSEIELKAINQGWIPKEEFDGDPSEFIDAPEFVRRGELFEKIERTSRELRQVRQALDAFKQHHSKVKEVEYERALKSLKEARKQAVIDGEHERAFALEEKIDEITQEKTEVAAVAQQPVPDESYTAEFQDWLKGNSWYTSNKTMRRAADMLGIELKDQGYNPTEILQMVEKEIKQEFAHRFQNPNTSRPPAVEASTRGGPKKDTFQLTPDEREIMRKIVGTGVMSEEDYIKEVKAMRK